MSEPRVASAVPTESRDRRVGLIIFGSLEIVCGCLSVLFVPLAVFSQMVSARMTGMPPQWGQLLIGLATYALLGVALILLGIGSIRRRRWARALSLILGWSWLLVGLVTLVIVALAVPSMTSQLPGQVPGSAPPVFLIVTLLFASCPMVFVPGALVLFYGSRHVKATCEAADPETGWTDACPLPVLAASLWMVFGAGTILLMMASGQAALPVFGTVLVGLPGILACFPLVLLWVYLAWALYRLRLVGWWLTLAVFVVFGASSIVTFARVDLMDLYQRMGYPEQQLEVLRRTPLLTGANLAIWLAVMIVAIIGYLVWIRPLFSRPAGGARP